MALQKQIVHLNMRGGVDAKRDDRLVIPSKLLDLRDAVFDDADTIITRGGLTSQSLTALDGATFGTPKRLFTNQGNLLVEDVYTTAGISVPFVRRVVKDLGQSIVTPESSVEASGAYFRRAGMTTRAVSGNIEKWPITSGSTNRAGQMDCASDGANATYSLWAWEERDTAGTGKMSIRAQVLHEPTQTVVTTLHLRDSASAGYVYSCPRVLYSADAGIFYLYFARHVSGGVSFKVQVVTVRAGSAFSAASDVYTSSAAGGTVGDNGYEPLFDAVCDADGTSVMLAVRNSSATMRDIALLMLSASDGFTVVDSTSTTLAATINTLTVGSEAGRVMTVFYNSSNLVKAVRWDVVGATFSAETTVATGAASTSIGRIAVYLYSATYWAVFYDNSTTAAFASPPTAEVQLRGAYVKTDLTATTGFRCFTGWLIGSRIVRSSRLYMAMFNPSDTQPTVYVVDVERYLAAQNTVEYAPNVVARIDYSECGYLRHDWKPAAHLSSPVTVGTNITFAYPKWVPDGQLVAGEYVQPTQVWRADLDFTDELGQGEANGLTMLAGACPHIYDGRGVYEEGFHHAPEIYSLTAVAGAGNLFTGLATGAGKTYRVTCTLGWQDARGNWHESAPADPVEVDCTTNGGVNAVLGVPPTLKTTYKVLWYRTVAGSPTGPFYRAFDQTGTTITSDTTLVDCEQLYTVPGAAGQALAHDPAPACRHIENHQGRLVLSGCYDGYRLAYSNVVQYGRAPEFSALLFRLTDYEFGRIVSTQSQDGKLVVLGERKIGALLGQGPDDTGAADGYSEIEVVVHDMGAKWTAPRSVATTNEGVWFQSSYGGLRIFGRNNTVARTEDGKHVGSEVDHEVASYIAHAVVGTSKQQIRFYHSNGGVLVFDTLWGQWSRFSNHTHVDAAFAEGRYYHITSTPALLYYNESAFTDNGTAITMYFKTPHLQFAGIQGFQRVTRVMFLGNPVDALSDTQVVTVQLGTNFTSSLTTVVNAQDVAVAASGLTQFEIQPTSQKCEALQVAVSIKSKTSASRFRLTDMTLQVGVKQGRFKTGASQRY